MNGKCALFMYRHGVCDIVRYQSGSWNDIVMNIRRMIWLVFVACVLSGFPYVVYGGGVVRAKPFVKWAGGKGQLLEQLDALLPEDFGQRKDLVYVEPFVGGGAMLFHMLAKYPNIKSAVINDANTELVNAYEIVRNRPEDLINRLSAIHNEFSGLDSEASRREMYLECREKFNCRKGCKLERASLFIFLNKTCYNGLYRVNSKGEFNVPFGKSKAPKIFNADNIRALSEALRKVTILKGDFADVMSSVKGNAFFYFDPPYRPLSQSAAFTAYAKGGFNDDEQRRLSQFCRRLDSDGHQWLLSNSDPHNTDPEDDFFEKLYDGFDIRRVAASRAINSKGDGRGRITELAIRNYRD